MEYWPGYLLNTQKAQNIGCCWTLAQAATPQWLIQEDFISHDAVIDLLFSWHPKDFFRTKDRFIRVSVCKLWWYNTSFMHDLSYFTTLLSLPTPPLMLVSTTYVRWHIYNCRFFEVFCSGFFSFFFETRRSVFKSDCWLSQLETQIMPLQFDPCRILLSIHGTVFTGICVRCGDYRQNVFGHCIVYLKGEYIWILNKDLSVVAFNDLSGI